MNTKTATLSEVMPEGEDIPQSGLVMVDTYFTTNDAYMARMKLENAGIDVFLENENINAVNPLYGPATGGIKLLVDSEKAAEATSILNVKQEHACPSCGSLNTEIVPISKELTALSFTAFLFALITFPLWLVRRKWQCLDCDHFWKG